MKWILKFFLNTIRQELDVTVDKQDEHIFVEVQLFGKVVYSRTIRL